MGPDGHAGFPRTIRVESPNALFRRIKITFQAGAAEPRIHGTILLPGMREADIVPLMQHFNKTWPTVRLSSLPSFTETGTQVELGLYGRHADVATAQAYLESELTQAGMTFSS